jgi:hypothetical protein
MKFSEVSALYQVGHIVELKVEKILVGPSLVIFDIEGVSARLHISNLSNNRELSEKLFNVLREGELVTSVITGFNAEKQYVELSLKPFRNYLEGSLGFMRCKKVVEDRQKMRVNLPPDILEENRNQLDRIQGDLAKVDLTFLYELIQNAIDHPNPGFNNQLHIKFEVYNEYLLLKHDGSIFTEDNFRSLTGILLGETGTSEERIGYKGIGFKSIFRYTNEVYVRSGNFSFTFSQERSGANMPWEVIPIFENEVDKVDEIKNFDFFNSPVAFAFKFRNSELRNQAITYLEQLIASKEALLFLDKLARLEIVIDGKVKRVVRDVDSYDSHQRVILQVNDDEPEEWLVCQEKQTIEDQEILRELNDENNPSIPSKFRNFRTPQIQIAFPLVPQSDLINLYAYLPMSETKHGLPYIVNGDFIPNLDRTDLIKNLKYNNSLSTLTAKVLSSTFKVVSQECGIDQALTLIPKFEESNTGFFGHLNEDFVRIQNDLFVILPTGVETRLQDFVIDKTGTFNILDSGELRLLENFGKNQILRSKDEDVIEQLIEKFGVGAFEMSNAVELLNKEEVRNKYFGTFSDLILLLFRFSRLPNALEWIEEISKLKLVTQGGTVLSLPELHTGVPQGFEETFKEVLQIEGVQQESNELLFDYPRIKELLLEFGLKTFDVSDTLRKLIDNASNISAENNPDKLNSIWHFLYLNRELVNQDQSKLVNDRFKKFPICTIGGGIELLENCIAGKIEDAQDDYSFLHKAYGKDNLTKIDLSGLKELTGASDKELIDFLKSIHEGVRITDRTLFKRAFKTFISLSKQEANIDDGVLINALASVYRFTKKHPQDDLDEIGLSEFSVLTKRGTFIKISFAYFDHSYSGFFEQDQLYAEQMFEGVEGVDFISEKYLQELQEAEEKSFVDFLIKCHVSPGLKFFSASTIRNGDLVNIGSVDDCYASFNNGYSNFRNSAEFFVLRDVRKLLGLHANLTVFWTNLSGIQPIANLTSNISCNGYSRPNPLIWLLQTAGPFFPMKDGSVKAFSQVCSKDIEYFLVGPEFQLDACFSDTLNPILEQLSFRSTLSNSDVIGSLQRLSEIAKERLGELILNHFVEATFTEDEKELILNTCYLIALDGSFQKVSDLIYVDEELSESSLALEQTTFPDNRLMSTFKFHTGFRNKIKELGLVFKGVDQIEVRSFNEQNESHSQILIDQILDFAARHEKNHDAISSLNSATFMCCSEIQIGLIGVPEYYASVDGYYSKSENSYYYIDLRDLIDVLCERFSWSQTLNRKMRKVVEQSSSQQESKSTKREKSFDYSKEELDKLKSLFSRQLEDSELEEENLYALVKGLRYFKDQHYVVTEAEAEFENTYSDKFLGPIIDESGTAYKVMCRSARRGVLFFGGHAWMKLGEENTMLYVLTGDKSSDCILINTQAELEEKLNSHFKVIRRKNTSFEDVQNIINAETDLTDLQILYKVKDGAFDIIFNPKQNNPGETEGPLVDIGDGI